jgi:hypothetical protein
MACSKLRYSLTALLPLTLAASTFAQQTGDLRRTALKSTSPSDEVVRLDLDKDGRPDIVERWWNGKRVRWLDENGDLSPSDTRGDMVADVLQVDRNGDGLYDGPLDLNVKWADNDGDGRADLQAFVTQPPVFVEVEPHDLIRRARGFQRRPPQVADGLSG